MSDKRDYYEVLGVTKEATETDLKNAFRSLARKYHPDRSTEDDAENKFKEIQEAYAVLSDGDKRQVYDRFGHNGPSGGSPFGGFGGGGGAGFNINLEDILGGDFFSSFFGGGTRRSSSPRGNDILIRHSIDLESVLNGSPEVLEIQLPVNCDDCNGTGGENGNTESCSDCSGKGRIRARQQIGPFVQDVVRECSPCGGNGRIIKSKCKSCKGSGRTNEDSKLRFNIPLGAEDGTRLRMRGKGEPPNNSSGESGDLFIELEVELHPWFERSNADLIMSLPLSYSDLVLGTQVELPHIDGEPLIIKVPALTNSGETLEIRRRGLPRTRGSGRGDVVVLVKLDMPKKVDKVTKKSLESIRQHIEPKDLISRVKADADKRRK
jgi:molecular chaperone DnaJ